MAFDFKAIVKPQHERGSQIQAQLASPLREIVSYDVFENIPTTLKVVRLPVNLPIYRMANGRTTTHQLAYVRNKALSADFFLKGEESDVGQQAQHEILRGFANESPGQITSIVEVLKQYRQRDPLLVTANGVVVNGNRRLAAMRDIYTDAPTEFPEFEFVECAVLPPLTPEQTIDIEIRLQMTPETKLPYGWIDECLMIQRQLNSSKTEAQIAHVMRTKTKEVKDAVSALKEVDIYLKDWRKTPGDYQVVEDNAKQFFYDLPSRLKGKSGELLEASRRVAWLLFDNSGELGQRVYAFNAMFGEKAEQVLSNLIERVEISEDEGDAIETDETPLDIDFGDSTPTSKYASIIGAIEDPARRDEIKDELVAVCQTIIDAGRTVKQGKSALNAVRDANSRLAEVDLTKADTSTYAGIEKQLEQVLHRAQELKTKLTPYLQASGKPTPTGEGT